MWVTRRRRGRISPGGAPLGAALALLIANGPVGAERVAIEAPTLGSQVARPNRGMAMTAVEERFGAPTERLASVGEPPITRWRYGQFTVYFERDRVIHTVVNR